MITSLLHILVIIGFLCLPLLSQKYMYIIRWIPLLLILIWIVFDGCPLTHIDKEVDNNYFIKSYLDKYIILSNSRVDALTYLFLFIIFILCTEKYYKKKL